VPDLERAILTPRDHLLAVGMEGDVVHEVRMPVEHDELATTGYLPQLEAAVFAGRGEGSAVRAEGETVDEPVVPEDRQPLLTSGAVAQLDRPVTTAACQPVPVGTEGDAVNPERMSRKIADLVAVLDRPKLDDLRARDREHRALGVEGQVVDATRRAE